MDTEHQAGASIRGPRGLHERHLSPVSGMMDKKRQYLPARALLAALLITSGLGGEIEDSQALKAVDLKKDGFDITLQALPSGELLDAPRHYVLLSVLHRKHYYPASVANMMPIAFPPVRLWLSHRSHYVESTSKGEHPLVGVLKSPRRK